MDEISQSDGTLIPGSIRNEVLSFWIGLRHRRVFTSRVCDNPVRSILQNVCFAGAAGQVGAGSVWRQRRKHDDVANFCGNCNSVVCCAGALPAETSHVVLESSEFVQSRHNPRTAILLCGVNQRDPAGQILLRLDIRVTVVLMPWKLFGITWLLVNGLIPIHPGGWANDISAQFLKYRVHAEVLQERRLCY